MGTLYNIDKKKTAITKWQSFLLFFVKAKFFNDQAEGYVIKYKTIRGKMFIIDQWKIPPRGYLCRHKFKEK